VLGQCAHDVPARDDPDQPLLGVRHREALHPVVHHQLQDARQFRCRIDIDEFRRHHIHHHPRQQIVIGRNHAARAERKAFQEIEVAHDADDVIAFAHRIAVEVVSLEHLVQLAHGGIAGNRLHLARHVLLGGRFEKSMHGDPSSL